jgi:hypothetical protein
MGLTSVEEPPEKKRKSGLREQGSPEEKASFKN